MISITLDLEWATRPVLRETLDLIDQYDVSMTLFSTHDDDLEIDDHERALHPNFDKEESVSEIMTSLTSLYPNATGLRSHQMLISCPLRTEFVEYGIEYESNYMAYEVEGLAPFMMPEGTLQFPVYWMDDVWFRNDAEPVDPSTLLNPSGLKVFDFHPPHICFNTPSARYYETHKEEYWADDADVERLRAEEYGVRDVFTSLLSYIERHNIETYTLGELYRAHEQNRPTDA